MAATPPWGARSGLPAGPRGRAGGAATDAESVSARDAATVYAAAWRDPVATGPVRRPLDSCRTGIGRRRRGGGPGRRECEVGYALESARARPGGRWTVPRDPLATMESPGHGHRGERGRAIGAASGGGGAGRYGRRVSTRELQRPRQWPQGTDIGSASYAPVGIGIGRNPRIGEPEGV